MARRLDGALPSFPGRAPLGSPEGPRPSHITQHTDAYRSTTFTSTRPLAPTPFNPTIWYGNTRVRNPRDVAPAVAHTAYRLNVPTSAPPACTHTSASTPLPVLLFRAPIRRQHSRGGTYTRSLHAARADTPRDTPDATPRVPRATHAYRRTLPQYPVSPFQPRTDALHPHLQPNASTYVCRVMESRGK